MTNRKAIRIVARQTARALSVLLLAAGIGTAMSPGLTAWAQNCATLDIVVARGTQEPGYLGAVIGDPLYAALSAQLPVDTTAHRVEYPADLLVPTSMIDGTRAMTSHVIDQAAACPDQRFVLVGYSQGAVVTHGTLGSVWLPGAWVLPPSCPRASSRFCCSATHCDSSACRSHRCTPTAPRTIAPQAIRSARAGSSRPHTADTSGHSRPRPDR